jgi:hypothetical protein
VDIKRGGSPDSNLNFYDQVFRVGKERVEHEFMLFIICRIATWNKVAKWVNILQDNSTINVLLALALAVASLQFWLYKMLQIVASLTDNSRGVI